MKNVPAHPPTIIHGRAADTLASSKEVQPNNSVKFPLQVVACGKIEAPPACSANDTAQSHFTGS